MITVDILMATYNGSEFIREQIESIINQEHKDWRLIIRDDGSEDNTVDIVVEYIKKLPEKIMLVDDSASNLGACQNFARLMEYSKSDYIMFCDQDDVWLPDKISITLNKMLEMERTYGKDTPLLVHTDLKVVDRNRDVLSDSFWKFQKLDPRKGKILNRLLVQNVVTGCTIIINSGLKKLSIPIPKDAIMHDWWITLVVAALGKIDYIDKTTVLYRQHSKNDMGAIEWDIKRIIQKALRFYRPDVFRQSISTIKDDFLKTQRQAKAFMDCYRQSLSIKEFEVVRIYSDLESYPFVRKRYYIFKYGFYAIGFMRNLGLIVSA